MTPKTDKNWKNQRFQTLLQNCHYTGYGRMFTCTVYSSRKPQALTSAFQRVPFTERQVRRIKKRAKAEFKCN